MPSLHHRLFIAAILVATPTFILARILAPNNQLCCESSKTGNFHPFHPIDVSDDLSDKCVTTWVIPEDTQLTPSQFCDLGPPKPSCDGLPETDCLALGPDCYWNFIELFCDCVVCA